MATGTYETNRDTAAERDRLRAQCKGYSEAAVAMHDAIDSLVTQRGALIGRLELIRNRLSETPPDVDRAYALAENAIAAAREDTSG